MSLDTLLFSAGENITASAFIKLLETKNSIKRLRLTVGGEIRVKELLDEIGAGRK